MQGYTAGRLARGTALSVLLWLAGLLMVLAGNPFGWASLAGGTFCLFVDGLMWAYWDSYRKFQAYLDAQSPAQQQQGGPQ